MQALEKRETITVLVVKKKIQKEMLIWSIFPELIGSLSYSHIYTNTTSWGGSLMDLDVHVLLTSRLGRKKKFSNSIGSVHIAQKVLPCQRERKMELGALN